MLPIEMGLKTEARTMGSLTFLLAALNGTTWQIMVVVEILGPYLNLKACLVLGGTNKKRAAPKP